MENSIYILSFHYKKIIHLLKLIKLWKRNYITRKQLANISNTQAVDIGITKEQIESEIKKRFWVS